MNKFLAILTLLLCTQSTEVLTWQEDQKLHWGNFKGEPQTNTDTVAITASGITYGYSAKMYPSRVEYTTTVTAQFYPQDSWYVKQHVNDTILKHEQLHFDITELHARKLRKAIANSKFTKNIKQEMAKIYNEVNQELKSMQDQYDAASDYSRNYSGQLKWQQFVFEELKKHQAYE